MMREFKAVAGTGSGAVRRRYYLQPEMNIESMVVARIRRGAQGARGAGHPANKGKGRIRSYR